MQTRQAQENPFDPDGTIPSAPGVKSLVGVRARSEQIRQSVEECAEDLATVNSVLKGELSAGPSEAGVGHALEKAETIEAKVQECAAELTDVNEALDVQVEERSFLDSHVVAVRKEAVMARHAAFHDPLTSLANRAMFDDRLDHGLAQAKRHGRTLGVLFIDLDAFKAVNDTYGHAAGDRVLMQIAARLKAMSRDEDTVSRHGGDEFLYLLTELRDEQDATAVAAKVLHTLSAPCEIPTADGTAQQIVRPSIGIAIYPKDGTTPATLMAKADEAMYSAKRSRAGFSFAR